VPSAGSATRDRGAIDAGGADANAKDGGDPKNDDAGGDAERTENGTPRDGVGGASAASRYEVELGARGIASAASRSERAGASSGTVTGGAGTFGGVRYPGAVLVRPPVLEVVRR
jgi:hypothetical protein